jgi:hypothetical protein
VPRLDFVGLVVKFHSVDKLECNNRMRKRGRVRRVYRQYGGGDGGGRISDDVRQAFRTRAGALIDFVASTADPSSIARALSASSNVDVVLTALEDPKVLAESSRQKTDPLARARQRGIKAMRKLLDAEGGSLGAGEVADLCGITPQAVNKRREAGTLLALRLGRREYSYPGWQFDQKGRPLSGLTDVLRSVHTDDPWMALSFFLTPDTRLGGKTPLAALREGKLEAVKAAASQFGEHGAP